MDGPGGRGRHKGRPAPRLQTPSAMRYASPGGCCAAADRACLVLIPRSRSVLWGHSDALWDKHHGFQRPRKYAHCALAGAFWHVLASNNIQKRHYSRPRTRSIPVHMCIKHTHVHTCARLHIRAAVHQRTTMAHTGRIGSRQQLAEMYDWCS